MAGPTITAARERFRENRPIAAAVVEGLRNAAANPDNALSARDVPVIAAAVQDAIARDPVAQNAMNAEPWWQSRVYVGIIIAMVTMVGGWLGIEINVSQADQNTIMQALPLFGLAVSAIGRGVKSLPPIRWTRPWTVVGIPANPFRRGG